MSEKRAVFFFPETGYNGENAAASAERAVRTDHGDMKNPIGIRARILKHRLRIRFKGWSSEKDRTFHDRHFAGPDFDPFQFDYPGYITIRRFADLTEPLLKGSRRVLDIGCGPAEITCELASRFPEIEFVGIDHSTAGIERARSSAARKNLDNATFHVADAESYIPREEYDVVTLFDAFHHLMDPSAFVRRMEPLVKRFVLIEPTGDWKGGWKRDLDLDWLLFDLDKIRRQIDYLTGREADLRKTPDSPPAGEGEAVEQRFSLRDLQGLFNGFTLRIQGTVSGLDRYPPGPEDGGRREWFNRIAYDLYKDIDEMLFAAGRDFAAKHWVICAEKQGTLKPRLPDGPVPAPAPSPIEITGPYDINYLGHIAPKKIPSGGEFRVTVRFRNRSYRTWAAGSDPNPEAVSYHWWDRRRSEIVRDGIRTPLPGPVPPGEERETGLRVTAPEKPGRYLLAIDFVKEGVAWFSDFGAPCLTIPIRIVRS